jgi:hypothetical protein
MKSLRQMILDVKRRTSPTVSSDVDEIIDLKSNHVKPSTLIGMSKQDAVSLVEKQQMLARIIREDDIWFVVTSDLHHNRMNLEIQKGVVVKAAIG